MKYWPGSNIPKSHGNAFDWRKIDRPHAARAILEDRNVQKGRANAKKGMKGTGLSDPVNVVFKTNIIAFSKAKKC